MKAAVASAYRMLKDHLILLLDGGRLYRSKGKYTQNDTITIGQTQTHNREKKTAQFTPLYIHRLSTTWFIQNLYLTCTKLQCNVFSLWFVETISNAVCILTAQNLELFFYTSFTLVVNVSSESWNIVRVA
mmetsp:Transcript_27705/g.58270  ORF Transcript_27705/g.58270 Transcript_27705/m.58270 type:complete len:130 (-) Transcript_27705:118-507(-)